MNQDFAHNLPDPPPENDPQLAELESRLAELSPAGPRPQLRDAVLQAVEQERRQFADRRARRVWYSVMAIAAVVVAAWCAPVAVMLVQLNAKAAVIGPSASSLTVQADDANRLPVSVTPAAARRFAMALQSDGALRE